jgi:hypothetical protein
MSVQKLTENEFSLLRPLRLRLDETGDAIRDIPHTQFQNAQGLRLLEYGDGPFCRLEPERFGDIAGVYALAIGDQAMFVRRTKGLEQRINGQIGRISPRQCFEGGNPTHIRVNHMVWAAAASGRSVDLWFCKIADQAQWTVLWRLLVDKLALPWRRSRSKAAQ